MHNSDLILTFNICSNIIIKFANEIFKNQYSNLGKFDLIVLSKNGDGIYGTLNVKSTSGNDPDVDLIKKTLFVLHH